MFIVVTDFIDAPAFWLICDNRSCGCSARADIDMTSAEAHKQSQARFIATAVKEKWAIGLDAQFCPLHNERMRALLEARNQEGKQLVQPVGHFDDLSYDAKRLKLVKT